MDHQLFFSSVTEPSQVAEARRLTTQLAAKVGFNETEGGKVAIVAAEAATNLVKHAQGGRLLVRVLKRADLAGIEILALDQGPGIANIGAALRDGYSTTGTPGTGLGAIIRLADLFDIYSLPDKGTALLAQLWPQASQRAAKIEAPETDFHSLEVGVVCLPKPGEQENGDSWGIERQTNRCLIMLVDGLGHGSGAAAAARAAALSLIENATLRPMAFIETAHTALRPTRGAALAVIELKPGQAIFSGIGNIAGRIISLEKNHHLTSHNGIVGHQLPRIQEFFYPWTRGSLLVLHSDGLTSRWSFDAYPGLMERHPSLIAGVLYRDFSRGYDDVTVLVAKL